MYLTATNLVHYLLARRLVTPASIVDGDFMVAEVGRRNRNYKVIRQENPGLFIKQIKTHDQQAMMTLHREAACYRLAGSDEKYAPLAELMPRFVDYDAARHLLTVELLPQGENLTEYHRRMNAFPEAVGRMLGRGLGAYHSEVGRMFTDEPDLAIFPRQVPWVLSLHQSSDAMLQSLSAGNTQLVGILRQQPAFQQQLDALREDWRFDSLLHGDMKWDNCIVFHKDEDTLDFRIVDWELADFGDASWDVGAVFQAYLAFWILSMPIMPGTAPAQYIDQAAYPLEAMQPAIRAFWQEYVAVRGLAADDEAARQLLERCMRHCAARMVQTVFEYMYASPQLSGNAVMLLQVSLNILQSPREAIAELLGL